MYSFKSRRILNFWFGGCWFGTSVSFVCLIFCCTNHGHCLKKNTLSFQITLPKNNLQSTNYVQTLQLPAASSEKLRWPKSGNGCALWVDEILSQFSPTFGQVTDALFLNLYICGAQVHEPTLFFFAPPKSVKVLATYSTSQYAITAIFCLFYTHMDFPLRMSWVPKLVNWSILQKTIRSNEGKFY